MAGAGATCAPARGVTALAIGSSDWLGWIKDEHPFLASMSTPQSIIGQ